MKHTRVHVLSAVNAGAVSKSGGRYTVANVCGAVDGIVMNGMAYMADQLAAGAPSLEGKPAPAGHPKDDAGRYISALSGNALLTSYAGAVCTNVRHEGGRTLYDVVVNEAQAKAHPDGAKLVDRLDAAMNGSNAEPIHVSTGLFCKAITANGESLGKKYQRIATEIVYDHSAFLLNESGAGTPEQGVGMFLNAAGEAEQVEAVTVNEALDRRCEGFAGWAESLLRKLLGNEDELSLDQIREGLYKALPEGGWVREVFARYAVWSDRDGRMYRQDYTVASDGSSVAFSGTAQEVREKREYEPVNNLQRDSMKDMIVNALRAAGISTEGLTDQALVDAYNAHVRTSAEAPMKAQLAAANAQLQTLQANAQQAETAELATLAAELAANAKGLTADDFKAMGLKRCKELKANGTTAAPVLPGSAAATTTAGAEFASYDFNALIDAADGAGKR
jgi:hypothetical protein